MNVLLVWAALTGLNVGSVLIGITDKDISTALDISYHQGLALVIAYIMIPFLHKSANEKNDSIEKADSDTFVA